MAMGGSKAKKSVAKSSRGDSAKRTTPSVKCGNAAICGTASALYIVCGSDGQECLRCRVSGVLRHVAYLSAHFTRCLIGE